VSNHVTDNRMELAVPATSRNALARAKGRTGEPCDGCGRKFLASEPAVVAGWTRMVSLHEDYLGWRFTKDNGVQCVECAGLRKVSPGVWRFYFEYKGSIRASDSYYNERPCVECARPTIMRREYRHRKYIFCCQPCEVAYYNRRRRVRPKPKKCEVCAKEFMPKRSDSKTCSSRCRQKAYRQRTKAAGSTNA
jgi:hypothetical protein